MVLLTSAFLRKKTSDSLEFSDNLVVLVLVPVVVAPVVPMEVDQGTDQEVDPEADLEAMELLPVGPVLAPVVDTKTTAVSSHLTLAQQLQDLQVSFEANMA